MDAIERAVRARQIELFGGRVSAEGLERLIAIALQVEREAGGVSRRGFASLSPAKRKRIAKLGGKAVHAKGTAHTWTPAEARVAGKVGGTVSRGGKGKLPAPAGGQAPPAVAVVPTASPAPPARRVVTYPVKPCAVCRRRFQPSGPRSKYCARPACVSTRASR
jgi:general stress protein YciG